MNPTVIARQLVGLFVGLVLMEVRPAARRDERGLSQSAEIAILVGGVAALALLILSVVRPYVLSKLPR